MTYDVSYRSTTIVLGLCIRDSCIHVKRAPSKSVERTPYELWFGKKPKLSFLKVWGCNAYVKKFHPDKLKPKSEKCVFIGYPKKLLFGTPSITDPKASYSLLGMDPF